MISPTVYGVYTEQEIERAVNTLVAVCHGLSTKAGWWTRKRKLSLFERLVQRFAPGCVATTEPIPVDGLIVSQKLALIHSEVSEALEGDRKGLMDDHLPDLKMFDVELGDAAIRLFDLAGAKRSNLGRAFVRKLQYNQRRADHKPENREKAGGKAY